MESYWSLNQKNRSSIGVVMLKGQKPGETWVILYPRYTRELLQQSLRKSAYKSFAGSGLHTSEHRYLPPDTLLFQQESLRLHRCTPTLTTAQKVGTKVNGGPVWLADRDKSVLLFLLYETSL